MKPKTRKEEIIKTSAILFKEKGFSAVTMRDIAKFMGIKAASLYNHISSKQEILSNIIISLAEQFTYGMDKIQNSHKSSIDKLNYIVELHVSITSNNTDGMASLNNDWMHLKDELEYYLKLRLDYEENFRHIIEQGIKNEELKNANAEAMLFSMLSTLRSLYIWIPNKDDLNTSKLASDLSHVLLTGIIK
ncbi:MAG: TetR/AcrR family transcriptional regulator [Bacteroidetes bacterium]|nr:MAG: TetR/AcrR family transcriptional regulator [Bacteroidota bacterium]